MILGPTFIYQCPQCKSLVSRGSLESGDIAGIRVYSDGKRVAPLLPQFPTVTRCWNCRHIFWINDAKEVGEYKNAQAVPWEWVNAKTAVFLTVYEYAEALAQDCAADEEQERYLRIRMWRGFNDRVREGSPLFNDEKDEELWTDNVEKLMMMLDEENPNQCVLLAELSRNLGQFQRCKELVKSLRSPEMNRVIDAFRRECDIKNTLVFQFK